MKFGPTMLLVVLVLTLTAVLGSGGCSSTQIDEGAQFALDALLVVQAFEHSNETGEPVPDIIVAEAVRLLQRATGDTALSGKAYQFARMIVLSDAAGLELPPGLVAAASLVWPAPGDGPGQAELVSGPSAEH